MAKVESKDCSRCKQHLPASHFSADRRATTGLQPACKDCHALSEKARRYKNIDDFRAWQRDYYHRTRSERLAWNAEWRKENRRIIRARAAKYYAKNKEKCIECVNECRRKYPEKYGMLARAMSARRRKRKADGDPPAKVAKWTARQAKVCTWCGANCASDYHVDHIIPLSRGGTHHIDNLCISCPPCNLSKGAKLPEEFKRATSAPR